MKVCFCVYGRVMLSRGAVDSREGTLINPSPSLSARVTVPVTAPPQMT